MRPNDARRIALALPGTRERLTWETPTFRVKNKIFLTLGDGRATVKVRKEHQHTIIASDPRTFSVAPYVGRFGWVTVRLSTIRARAMRVLIIDSWRLIAPKRAVVGYEAAEKRRKRTRR